MHVLTKVIACVIEMEDIETSYKNVLVVCGETSVHDRCVCLR